MMERKKKTVLGTKEDNKISLILLFQEVKTETWFYVDFIQKRNRKARLCVSVYIHMQHTK